jgi:sigma-B regulation protein RsbU (phosphoserine phosphatase)
MMPAAEICRPRVLIVDDEPDVETLIRQRFKRRPGDFDFVFARDGKEALDMLNADPCIEVVVTDINMPVMDGLTLLGNLNSFNHGRLLKAVVLSAYGDMGNIRTAMNRGAFDFLTKPIDFQDFEVTLRRTLEALHIARQGMKARAQLTALEQELDIASRIQASMLPQTFELAGRPEFALYAEMKPARRVGGDFYDFFPVGADSLGFLVGDVSGKGIPAALFMAVSRTLLRATALQGFGPAECMRYSNDIILGQSPPGVYVTAFYGILNGRTGRLDYCLAGHTPPFVVSPSGDLNRLRDPISSVIGLLPGAEYETGTVQLRPGDSVFLYTDGVTEAANSGDEFCGERRLAEVLACAATRAPREIVEAVQRAVADYAATTPENDDITAFCVQWRASD